jgi:hypothetical protein
VSDMRGTRQIRQGTIQPKNTTSHQPRSQPCPSLHRRRRVLSIGKGRLQPGYRHLLPPCGICNGISTTTTTTTSRINHDPRLTSRSFQSLNLCSLSLPDDGIDPRVRISDAFPSQPCIVTGAASTGPSGCRWDRRGMDEIFGDWPTVVLLSSNGTLF